jgi:UDP-N-acetylmuramate-alanine ligase
MGWMMEDIDIVKKQQYFAKPPYSAMTFGTGLSAVMSANSINCAVFGSHGRTLTDTMSAKIIADKWNNEDLHSRL